MSHNVQTYLILQTLSNFSYLHLRQSVNELLEVFDGLGAVPLFELGGNGLRLLAQRRPDRVEVLEMLNDNNINFTGKLTLKQAENLLV